jgi:hypothetical protein
VAAGAPAEISRLPFGRFRGGSVRLHRVNLPRLQPRPHRTPLLCGFRTNPPTEARCLWLRVLPRKFHVSPSVASAEEAFDFTA